MNFFCCLADSQIDVVIPNCTTLAHLFFFPLLGYAYHSLYVVLEMHFVVEYSCNALKQQHLKAQKSSGEFSYIVEHKFSLKELGPK